MIENILEKRAICYMEMKEYKKAFNDLSIIIENLEKKENLENDERLQLARTYNNRGICRMEI